MVNWVRFNGWFKCAEVKCCNVCQRCWHWGEFQTLNKVPMLVVWSRDASRAGSALAIGDLRWGQLGRNAGNLVAEILVLWPQSIFLKMVGKLLTGVVEHQQYLKTVEFLFSVGVEHSSLKTKQNKKNLPWPWEVVMCISYDIVEIRKLAGSREKIQFLPQPR